MRPAITVSIITSLTWIDTAILIAGVLTAAAYFDANDADETEIRHLADVLYRRVDWTWAQNGQASISHGWDPESGFIEYRWDQGYCEAHLLYVLALGSPSFPIEPDGYQQWISTFEWRTLYDTAYIYAARFSFIRCPSSGSIAGA
jgi:hypothetical protein